MERKEIIDLARKNGMTEFVTVGSNALWEQIEKFVTIAIGAEREACAVIAEEWFCGCGRGNCPEGDRRAHDIADSIRARGETTLRGEA
jgi:hypothetical protein